ncbi:MAG: hypothetical protein Q9195_002840 [Heterodermia aff. obscurata]
MVGEFKKVMEEEVEVCRRRNDVTSTQLTLLMHGTDRVFLVDHPRFHLARYRHQFIAEAHLDSRAMHDYREKKKQYPTATFTLRSESKEDLKYLTTDANGRNTFKASIQVRVPNAPVDINNIIKDVNVAITNVVKDRSLKGRFRDAEYPVGHMPFYLYGDHAEAHIDHILVRSPNIHLSASNVKLELDKQIPESVFVKGALVSALGIEEAAMQPFQPTTEGSHNNSFSGDSGFFFRTGEKFDIKVFEDCKDVNATGPGLAEMDDAKLLAEGTMTLGEDIYVDSYWLNRDPYERVDGDEKFKQWNKVFEGIELELK